MKTAVTVLQEFLVKFGDVPEYKCVAETGPPHLAVFEFRCSARGVAVTASARSKREAKQEAARLALLALAARGEPVPGGCGEPVPGGCGPPRAAPAAPPAAPPPDAPAPRTHVALLKELCDEYRLGALQYTLVSDTGPAHLRHFTVRASVGRQAREATSTTKKAARQLAAEDLYRHLRENLSRLTDDFVEEDALVRAHEKAMDRYERADHDERGWRPDLGRRVADYHRGLVADTEPEQQEAARRVLAAAAAAAAPEAALQEAAAALGMALEWSTLPTRAGGDLHVVALEPGAPPLTLSGRSRALAAEAALAGLRQLLRHRPDRPAPAPAPA